MTDDAVREALKAAIDALESLQGGCTDHDDGTVEAITVWCLEIIDRGRAALAQSEQARGYTDITADGGMDPRNAAPPPLAVRPLTDGQIEALLAVWFTTETADQEGYSLSLRERMRAVLAAATQGSKP